MTPVSSTNTQLTAFLPLLAADGIKVLPSYNKSWLREDKFPSIVQRKRKKMTRIQSKHKHSTLFQNFAMTSAPRNEYRATFLVSPRPSRQIIDGVMTKSPHLDPANHGVCLLSTLHRYDGTRVRLHHPDVGSHSGHEVALLTNGLQLPAALLNRILLVLQGVPQRLRVRLKRGDAIGQWSLLRSGLIEFGLDVLQHLLQGLFRFHQFLIGVKVGVVAAFADPAVGRALHASTALEEQTKFQINWQLKNIMNSILCFSILHNLIFFQLIRYFLEL